MVPASLNNQAHGVRVRWGRNDGLPAGIKIFDANRDDEFLPWRELLAEINSNLLPQMFTDPREWHFVLNNFNGKTDWLVQVVDGQENVFCDVWFGSTPPKWTHEGFVKIGVADDPSQVWQTYERYSDGSYRLKQSLLPTLDTLLDVWALSRKRMSET